MSQEQDWRLALGIGTSVLGPVIGSFAAGLPGALIGGAIGTGVGVAVGRNTKDRVTVLATGAGSTLVAGVGSVIINKAAGQPLDRSVLGSLGTLINGGSKALPSSGGQYQSSPSSMGGFAGPPAAQSGNVSAGYQPPGQQFASPYDPGGSQGLQTQNGQTPLSLGGVTQLLTGSPAGGAAPPAQGQANAAAPVSSTLVIALVIGAFLIARK